MQNYGIEYSFHAMARAGNLKGLNGLFDRLGEYDCTNIINHEDHRGFTVLHISMESGNLELIKMLIAKGANIHAKVTGQDPKGWTALHLAAFEIILR